jgi:hypothetical protein
MSRRRWNVRDAHQLYVMVAVRCGRPARRDPETDDATPCGGDLGNAFQYRDQHPRAGESVPDARDGALSPRPGGGHTWDLGLCSLCGASPQRRWEDIVDTLDQLDERGRWREVLYIT